MDNVLIIYGSEGGALLTYLLTEAIENVSIEGHDKINLFRVSFYLLLFHIFIYFFASCRKSLESCSCQQKLTLREIQRLRKNQENFSGRLDTVSLTDRSGKGTWTQIFCTIIGCSTCTNAC